MNFPPGYIIALTPQEAELKWPNIKFGINSEITSLKKTGYNCLGFAIGEENKDADMLIFSKKRAFVHLII